MRFVMSCTLALLFTAGTCTAKALAHVTVWELHCDRELASAGTALQLSVPVCASTSQAAVEGRFGGRARLVTAAATTLEDQRRQVLTFAKEGHELAFVLNEQGPGLIIALDLTVEGLDLPMASVVGSRDVACLACVVQTDGRQFYVELSLEPVD